MRTGQLNKADGVRSQCDERILVYEEGGAGGGVLADTHGKSHVPTLSVVNERCVLSTTLQFSSAFGLEATIYLIRLQHRIYPRSSRFGPYVEAGRGILSGMIFRAGILTAALC